MISTSNSTSGAAAVKEHPKAKPCSDVPDRDGSGRGPSTSDHRVAVVGTTTTVPTSKGRTNPTSTRNNPQQSSAKSSLKQYIRSSTTRKNKLDISSSERSNTKHGLLSGASQVLVLVMRVTTAANLVASSRIGTENQKLPSSGSFDMWVLAPFTSLRVSRSHKKLTVHHPLAAAQHTRTYTRRVGHRKPCFSILLTTFCRGRTGRDCC